MRMSYWLKCTSKKKEGRVEGLLKRLLSSVQGRGIKPLHGCKLPSHQPPKRPMGRKEGLRLNVRG